MNKQKFDKITKFLNKIGLRKMFPISYKKYLELQEELKNNPPICGDY